MNKQQLSTMAVRLNLKKLTTSACELVLIDGLKPYRAEKQVYGRDTRTIRKACDRLEAESAYCAKVAQQGRDKCEALGARGAK